MIAQRSLATTNATNPLPVGVEPDRHDESAISERIAAVMARLKSIMQ